MSKTYSQVLSEYFVRTGYDDLPSAEIDKIKQLLLDYFGVAVSGSQTVSGTIAGRYATTEGGRADAALIGHGGKVTAGNAAFANAISSHSIELDDVDVLALFHYSPPVYSAALAAAQRTGASGKQLLTAILLGCEMMARASNATNFSLRNRGYHTTPVCGVFGATVAAGKLLGLDDAQMVSALGLAGAQSAGLMEMYGPSMQKRFNPGPAARSGVTSALMAQMGFTGAATIFEGKYGFCQAYSDKYDAAELTKGLGETFNLDIEFKPHSCARPIHNAIDCAIGVRSQLKVPVAQIKSMVMRRHPAWANYHLNATPATYHEAQVSLPYSVAIALIEGAALPQQYQNDKLDDAEVLRLSKLLEVVPDESLPRGVSCHLTVTTDEGAQIEVQVDHPLGSIENPMSAADLRRKFDMLTQPVVGTARSAQLADALGSIETRSGIDDVLAMTVAETPRTGALH